MNLTLKKISKILNAKIQGDLNIQITGINTLKNANSSEISYVRGSKYLEALSETNAGAVITTSEFKAYCPTTALIVEDASISFAIISQEFKLQTFNTKVSLNDNKANEVFLKQGCFIGKNVQIGKNTILEANCVIEDNVSIGENSRIGSNVTIQNSCKIGNNCIILPGVVIGSEGFGNVRNNEKKWHTISHLG